jgi:hypothetical protein
MSCPDADNASHMSIREYNVSLLKKLLDRVVAAHAAANV